MLRLFVHVEQETIRNFLFNTVSVVEIKGFMSELGDWSSRLGEDV